MNALEKKRQNGQYFTDGNPFRHRAFHSWAKRSNIQSKTILEPFAGANNLITHLEDMGLCNDSVSYDLYPSNARVNRRDTLKRFPSGFGLCVTNPPWLAKNSATFRGLDFPDCRYDDLYKLALEKCLDNCEWVAALVPESFICTRLFRERLTDFISLPVSLFKETGHPVGLALFQPENVQDVKVWFRGTCVGLLSKLEALRPRPKPEGPLLFDLTTQTETWALLR